MPYYRVIPRDLFNESKLLKCLGQIALFLNDYEGRYPIKLEHDRPEQGFMIDQIPSDGGIYCRNLRLLRSDGLQVKLYHPLNSKEPYPLCYEFREESGSVFDDDGTFSHDFVETICTV